MSEILVNLPVGTTINCRLTSIRDEAISHNSYKTVQGDGPWWMCTITPPRMSCEWCHHETPEGYFKAASHQLEVAFELALLRLSEFRNVARSGAVQGTQDQEANTK